MERNTRQDPYGLKRPRSQNGIASLYNNLARFVLGFAIIFAFAALGQFVVWQYQRQSELQEAAMLSDQLLRRVELSADYAVIALGDLLENEHYACSGDQEVEFGDFIKSKGAVKDVAIIDNKGNVQCSGAGTLDGLRSPPLFPHRGTQPGTQTCFFRRAQKKVGMSLHCSGA